jgi:Protein of unknown function (DUF3106)
MLRRQTKHFAARILLNVACTLAVFGSSGYASAQTAAAQPPQTGTAAPAITWASLTASQKAALAPLQSNWESLSDGHQRKWIALSQNFASMSGTDKEKLHSRMVEWAALKPKERQQARLNFAETKKTPPEQRAANWEAYQALSTEEKEALAKTASTKPAGAAIATKAPAPQKLTPVPVTRNSPDTQKEKLAAQQPVDRNTLLPLAPPAKSNATN